jgi:hypothetical protein
MNKFLSTALIAGALSGCYMGEGDKNRASSERLKNGLSAIVTGIAAQKTYGTSDVHVTIERPFEFDSDVQGTTTDSTIDVVVKLPMQNNEFHATVRDGMLKGSQEKWMFNWDLDQIAANQYKLARFGFNGTLTLDVQDGRITGRYSRPLAFDYKFEGTINPQTSEYDLRFKIPWELDWKVRGAVRPPLRIDAE